MDKDRNTLSVFHVLDDWTARLPLAIPRLVAVSTWTLDPEDMGRDFQATLEIRSPNKQQPPAFQPFSVNFPADRKRCRTYHFVKGLRVEEAGELEFRILLNGEYKASHYVSIVADEEAT